jgi:hypothetical protein
MADDNVPSGLRQANLRASATYTKCMVENIYKYVRKSTEPADTIVTAAKAACLPEEIR